MLHTSIRDRVMPCTVGRKYGLQTSYNVHVISKIKQARWRRAGHTARRTDNIWSGNPQQEQGEEADKEEDGGMTLR